MQRLEGESIALVHAEGTIIIKELQDTESICEDAGCLGVFSLCVNYDIQFVGGFRMRF